MAEIPTREPAKLVAGDTWRWKRTGLESDYPASVWALKYVLLNSAGKIEITAEADGDSFLVNEAAANTANHVAGIYAWEAFVTDGTDRFRVGGGTVEILANFLVAASKDMRSHARRVLDSIEAVLERRATKDQQSYEIDGRRLDRTPIADLLNLRDYYRREAASELAAERLASGMKSGRTILVRFGGS